MGLKIVVVGAGPVGALSALYAARRADVVEVYELRNDLRNPDSTPLNFTKSINLALSERGINSIRHAQYPNLAETILRDTIPMHGRMIHGSSKGKLFEASQNYDIYGRAILATDRSGLNKILLDELEKLPNVKLFFNHRLTGADFKNKRAWFESRKPWRGSDKNVELRNKRAAEIEVPFDLLIGADGAHSAARFHLMKYARVSYQQDYIDTLWCEFTIAPADAKDPNARADGFQLSPNHLHIWPAGSLMFIAIPSADRTFTCTLFMSAAEFEAIDANPEDLIPFFNKNFPGVASQLIPEADLKQQYAGNPHLPLISIKCAPYHYGSSVVIVGDAAHAMVPFYGQGMNAGFEDVRVLFEIYDRYMSQITNNPPLTFSDQSVPFSLPNAADEQTVLRAAVLKEYTATRKPDAHVINDLAMGNLHEMRASVRSRAYLVRKRVEEWLSVWAPSLGFRTQYSRVSFSNERYSDVVINVYRQHAMLNAAGAALGFCTIVGGIAAWRLTRR